VIGHPVAHSRSPWIHTRFAELLGEALAYDRELAPLDGFAATVQRLRADGVAGCNVTVPFKFEAAALATRLTERARLACACNLLRFDGDAVVGDNTDGWGLVHDITAGAGFDLAGRDLLLVGAGGAAAGVLGPLLGTGLRRIVIVNRSLDRARRLARHHADLAARQNVELQVENPQDLKASFDVVVNATAASLNGAAPPVPASALRPGTLALDMMYGPPAQAFLDWAAAQGAQPRDGLGMLVAQAAEAFFVWRGRRPPVAPVLAALRSLLADEAVGRRADAATGR